MDELKPCPFCGGEAEHIDREIWCDCGVNIQAGDLQSIPELIDQWNTRASDWVSVEDRLPDVIGDYLCFDKGGLIAWAFFTNTKKWAYSGCYGENGFYKNVTHWMPLPKPPTGDE